MPPLSRYLQANSRLCRVPGLWDWTKEGSVSSAMGPQKLWLHSSSTANDCHGELRCRASPHQVWGTVFGPPGHHGKLPRGTDRKTLQNVWPRGPLLHVLRPRRRRAFFNQCDNITAQRLQPILSPKVPVSLRVLFFLFNLFKNSTRRMETK